MMTKLVRALVVLVGVCLFACGGDDAQTNGGDDTGGGGDTGVIQGDGSLVMMTSHRAEGAAWFSTVSARFLSIGFTYRDAFSAEIDTCGQTDDGNMPIVEGFSTGKNVGALTVQGGGLEFEVPFESIQPGAYSAMYIPGNLMGMNTPGFDSALTEAFYTISGTGGSGAAAFSLDGEVPAALEQVEVAGSPHPVNGSNNIVTLPSSSDLHLSWDTSAGTGDFVVVMVETTSQDGFPDVICFAQDDGAFTVPADRLATLDRAGNAYLIQVQRYRTTVVENGAGGERTEIATLWSMENTFEFDEVEDPCAGKTCSGHGTCEAGGGTADCACDSGYAGPACGECAAGYEESPPGSGTCASAECEAFGPFTGSYLGRRHGLLDLCDAEEQYLYYTPCDPNGGGCAGAYPVLFWIQGTCMPYDSDVVHEVLQEAARHCFIAVSPQYYNGGHGGPPGGVVQPGWCEGREESDFCACPAAKFMGLHEAKARCIFNPFEADPVSVQICDLPYADCDSMVAAGGSQGAGIAVRGAYWGPKAVAAYALPLNDEFMSVYRHWLPDEDLLEIHGAADEVCKPPFGTGLLEYLSLQLFDGESDPELDCTTKCTEPTDADWPSCDCRSGEGGHGYLVVGAGEVQDGTPDHAFLCDSHDDEEYVGECADLDPGFLDATGTADGPWSWPAVLEFLRNRT